MKRNTLKYIIILGIVSLTGIFSVQFIYLRNSFTFTERQFHENTSIALKEVALQIVNYNNEVYGRTTSFEIPNPVERISNNYYIVNVNDVIDGDILEYYLKEEFRQLTINTDFEFAVYDCENDEMVYGAYICADSNTCDQIESFNFPKSEKYTYYFGVNFPDRSPYFNSRLKGWYLSTSLLLLVVFFFGYSLYVIIKQRQLSAIQKNFINNLTHELKTPISSIGLSAGVINDKNIINTPDRLFKYAKIILEQNNRLSKNVEKVLHLASLEKNKIKLKKEIFGLNKFIENTIERFKHSELGENAKIIFNPELTEINIDADKFHFANIVHNILENAIKYCEKEPEIIIRDIRDKKAVSLEIIDNGIGIPKELRKKIFQKFYRISTGDVHNVKGFGLGLDYVKKIVKVHGWKIKVDNNPSGGSIFTIIIPLNNHG